MAAAAAAGAVGFIPAESVQPPPNPVFGLPFAGEPSLDGWSVKEWYGNTTFAYRMRQEFYRSGQGLHFGIDLTAHCGTPVLAIGEGVVREVDGPRRAWPHHLIVEHTGGVYSLYGHLHERSALRVGDRVGRGDQVGVSGDSATAQCEGSPHLHLEIRTNHLRSATNPVPWIEADWPAAPLGWTGAAFQVDLENPTRWQSIYDQPDVQFWGAPLNDYARPWP